MELRPKISKAKREEMEKKKREYIEESIRIWIQNKDSEMGTKGLKTRRPHYWNETIKELGKRGLLKK
jgi:uncharacterized Fe-S cluster-containing radical SAM superfamily enzyme